MIQINGTLVLVGGVIVTLYVLNKMVHEYETIQRKYERYPWKLIKQWHEFKNERGESQC